MKSSDEQFSPFRSKVGLHVFAILRIYNALAIIDNKTILDNLILYCSEPKLTILISHQHYTYNTYVTSYMFVYPHVNGSIFYIFCIASTHVISLYEPFFIFKTQLNVLKSCKNGNEYRL